jgi:hypothetical protein
LGNRLLTPLFELAATVAGWGTIPGGSSKKAGHANDCVSERATGQGRNPSQCISQIEQPQRNVSLGHTSYLLPVQDQLLTGPGHRCRLRIA